MMIANIAVPADEINNVMTGNGEWESDGLGKSGETYLVGQDYLMRSVSRFLIETPESYIQTLVALGATKDTITRIRQYKTSILAQSVRTSAVEESLMGKQGLKIIRDYRDISVLSSYSPLQIEGLKWAILSEIDLAEAYTPIYDFERQLVISATILMLLVILLAMVMASLFVKPINQLIASARQVAAGQLGIHSGDIVAGIVGRNKFIDDVWGDTINIASTLKSACPEGSILVSDEIHHRLCDLYEFALLATKIEDGETILEAWQLKSTIKK